MSRVSATPLYFGQLDRRLFGWLHLPSPDVRQRLGVVICPPLWQEAINAHRTVRHLAEVLAAVGLPVLRFDYDGCGNSSGDDRDPGRLDAWVGSVRSAIDSLKRLGGVDRVLVIGIRFGATLATLASISRDDLAGVISLAPVTSGRALVREWKAMGLVRSWKRRGDDSRVAVEAPSGDGSIEAAGFVMTAQTSDSINRISLLDTVHLPCPMFVIDRDDVTGSERWIERLEAAGVNVKRAVLPGYMAMMNDPAYAKVPLEMVRTVVIWAQQCAEQHDVRLADSTSAGAEHGDAAATSQVAHFPPFAENGEPIMETVLVRDESGKQFGVLSEPARASTSSSQFPPALLLVNSGAVHNVGPNRLYVLLARYFASLGFLVLRIDISGLGDSDAHEGEPTIAPYTPMALRDIARWTDYLRHQRGATHCHLLGICSGAYHAYRSAIAQLPLTSVIAVNPVNFYWREGMSLDLPLPDHHVVRIAAGYRQSLTDPEKWRKVLAGDADLSLAARVTARRLLDWIRRRVRSIGRLLRIPLKDDLSQDLKAACDHDTRIEFIFSEGDPGQSILHEQAGGMVYKLRQSGKLQVQEVAGADHTFSSEASRRALKSILNDRLNRRPDPLGSAG